MLVFPLCVVFVSQLWTSNIGLVFSNAGGNFRSWNLEITGIGLRNFVCLLLVYLAISTFWWMAEECYCFRWEKWIFWVACFIIGTRALLHGFRVLRHCVVAPPPNFLSNRSSYLWASVEHNKQSRSIAIICVEVWTSECSRHSHKEKHERHEFTITANPFTMFG